MLFTILSYLLAFIFIIINDTVAERVINWIKKDQHMTKAILIMITFLSIHVFMLGTGLRTLFGW